MIGRLMYMLMTMVIVREERVYILCDVSTWLFWWYILFEHYERLLNTSRILA